MWWEEQREGKEDGKKRERRLSVRGIMRECQKREANLRVERCRSVHSAVYKATHGKSTRAPSYLHRWGCDKKQSVRSYRGTPRHESHDRSQNEEALDSSLDSRWVAHHNHLQCMGGTRMMGVMMMMMSKTQQEEKNLGGRGKRRTGVRERDSEQRTDRARISWMWLRSAWWWLDAAEVEAEEEEAGGMGEGMITGRCARARKARPHLLLLEVIDRQKANRRKRGWRGRGIGRRRRGYSSWNVIIIIIKFSLLYFSLLLLLLACWWPCLLRLLLCLVSELVVVQKRIMPQEGLRCDAWIENGWPSNVATVVLLPFHHEIKRKVRRNTDRVYSCYSLRQHQQDLHNQSAKKRMKIASQPVEQEEDKVMRTGNMSEERGEEQQ